jgi:hypothetical protein
MPKHYNLITGIENAYIAIELKIRIFLKECLLC